jgi:acyl-coenzyme A synthetase/AMP-(fatty) acid ligase
MTVDEFPLTGSGKIQKYVLRERWLASGGTSPGERAANQFKPLGSD